MENFTIMTANKRLKKRRKKDDILSERASACKKIETEDKLKMESSVYMTVNKFHTEREQK